MGRGRAFVRNREDSGRDAGQLQTPIQQSERGYDGVCTGLTGPLRKVEEFERGGGLVAQSGDGTHSNSDELRKTASRVEPVGPRKLKAGPEKKLPAHQRLNKNVAQKDAAA